MAFFEEKQYSFIDILLYNTFQIQICIETLGTYTIYIIQWIKNKYNNATEMKEAFI